MRRRRLEQYLSNESYASENISSAIAPAYNLKITTGNLLLPHGKGRGVRASLYPHDKRVGIRALIAAVRSNLS